MIIDCHTHIFSPAMISRRAELSERDPVFAALYRHPAAGMATLEELIEAMDRCEVDMSVACNIGWTGQDLCRESNDYLLEAVARFPTRIMALVAVFPPAGDAAIKELERCIKAGCRGLGEMRPSRNFLAEPYDKPWTELAELLLSNDLVWMGHATEPAGHRYSGKGDLTPEAYYPFIRNHPHLKMILSHWGGGMPFYHLMPSAAKTLENVFYDTAASPLLYFRDVFNKVPAITGSDRILFGSDFPLVSPSRVIEQVGSAALSREEKQMILGGNAMSLFNPAPGAVRGG